MTEPRKEILGDGIELWFGDCRDVLPMIGRVDAVVTDPPYGISYQSGWATETLWAGGDRIHNDLDTSCRDSALSLFGPIPMLVFGSRKAAQPQNTRMVLIWDKGPALGMGALDLPWKPSTEEIYVIGHGFVGARDEGSVLYCPPVQSMAKNGRLHPNEKPVGLLARLIRKLPDGVIGDPFMGSGTAGVAAVKMGRSFIGIEIEPKYYDIARRRISEALKQPRLSFEETAKPKQEALGL